MILRIDDEKCTGHGRCYSLAPELFEPDDFGHGRVTVADVPEAQSDQARLAEANCPERAITIDG